MSRTAEMFAKPPRAKPRVMMHWDDIGADREGHFVCARCRFNDWYCEVTDTDFRRGVPCPKCNSNTSSEVSK